MADDSIVIHLVSIGIVKELCNDTLPAILCGPEDKTEPARGQYSPTRDRKRSNIGTETIQTSVDGEHYCLFLSISWLELSMPYGRGMSEERRTGPISAAKNERTLDLCDETKQ